MCLVKLSLFIFLFECTLFLIDPGVATPSKYNNIYICKLCGNNIEASVKLVMNETNWHIQFDKINGLDETQQLSLIVHEFPPNSLAADGGCSDIGKVHQKLFEDQDFQKEYMVNVVGGKTNIYGRSLALSQGNKVSCGQILGKDSVLATAKFPVSITGYLAIFYDANIGQGMLLHSLNVANSKVDANNTYSWTLYEKEVPELDDSSLNKYNTTALGKAILGSKHPNELHLSETELDMGKWSQAVVSHNIKLPTGKTSYSIVISGDDDNTVAWATLRHQYEETYQATFDDQEPYIGQMTFKHQPGTLSVTQATVELRNLTKLGAFHVHEFGKVVGGNCSTKLLGGHLDPFSKVYEDSRSITEDQVQIGDLSIKMRFGKLENKTKFTKTLNDTNLPLLGPNAIVFKAIIIHEAGYRKLPVRCANILPVKPFTNAIARFLAPLKGHVIFQQVTGSPLFYDTSVSVNLDETVKDVRGHVKWFILNEKPKTEYRKKREIDPLNDDDDDHGEIEAEERQEREEQTPSGSSDATMKTSTPANHVTTLQKSGSTLKLWCNETIQNNKKNLMYNPFMAKDWEWEEGKQPSLKHKVGDLTSKHGALKNIERLPVLVSNRRQYQDPLLPLEGDFTIVGRILVLMEKNEVLECAKIVPYKMKSDGGSTRSGGNGNAAGVESGAAGVRVDMMELMVMYVLVSVLYCYM